MLTILSYDFAWPLRILLSLFLLAGLCFLIKKYTIFKFSLIFFIIGSLFFIFYLFPFNIYLESPSRNQNAYELKYDTNFKKGIVFTSFSSKLVKFYQQMDESTSILSLRLLNEDFCLMVNWTSSLSDTDKLIGTYFGQKIIIPKEKNDILCPEVLTSITFTNHKFKYEFKRESATSAKHIYFLN